MVLSSISFDRPYSKLRNATTFGRPNLHAHLHEQIPTPDVLALPVRSGWPFELVLGSLFTAISSSSFSLPLYYCIAHYGTLLLVQTLFDRLVIDESKRDEQSPPSQSDLNEHIEVSEQQQQQQQRENQNEPSDDDQNELSDDDESMSERPSSRQFSELEEDDSAIDEVSDEEENVDNHIQAIEDEEAEESQETARPRLSFKDPAHNESLVNQRAATWLHQTYEEAINQGKLKEEKRVSKAEVWQSFCDFYESEFDDPPQITSATFGKIVKMVFPNRQIRKESRAGDRTPAYGQLQSKSLSRSANH